MFDSAQFTLTAKRCVPLNAKEASHLAGVLRPLAHFTFAELCSGEPWMPWSRFPPDSPSFGFFLNITRDLPLTNKVAFTSKGYELAETATAIRLAINNAECSVRAIDLAVPWDANNARYAFENVSLPEDLLLYWQDAARENELSQVKQALIEQVDLVTAENLVSESIGPDVLYRIFGTSAEAATDSALASFRRLAAQAIAGDQWWTYDAVDFGEGNGVALVRSDNVVEYIELASEW